MTVVRPTIPARQRDCLLNSYDGVICDLDGVVYRGAVAVPGAIESLETLMADGRHVVFATNNASRPPEEVGAHLRDLGLDSDSWSVVTSSQAAAAHVAASLAPGTKVCAVGGPGVSEALLEVGLQPVPACEAKHGGIGAVVQGLGADVTWRDLATVGHLVQRGATWVATNLDIMLPTADGPAPGNGALVAAVRTTTDASPHVVGKPGPDLYDLSRSRLHTDVERTLAVGDRLDTDIEGAIAAGLDSLFVLSGASRLQDLALADRHARPTYVGFDLSAALTPVPRIGPAPSHLATVTASGDVELFPSGDRQRQLHALVSTAWDALDRGHPVSTEVSMWRELERRLGLIAP